VGRFAAQASLTTSTDSPSITSNRLSTTSRFGFEPRWMVSPTAQFGTAVFSTGRSAGEPSSRSSLKVKVIGPSLSDWDRNETLVSVSDASWPRASLRSVPPSFLNSREDAFLLWSLIILGLVFYKDPRGTATAVWGGVRALCTPKLLLLYGSAALYSAGVVLLASRLDLWHRSALRETIYWFLGTAVVLVGYAVTHPPGDKLFLKILRRALAVTIIVEFAVNLYVFPLLVEIILIALVLLFFGMQAFAQRDSTIDAATRKAIDVVILAIGVFLLASFAVRALSDLEGFLSRDTAERLLVVPLFTLTLIPFLFLVAWYSQRELGNMRARFGATRNHAAETVHQTAP
jgi:hypothetical protein